MQRTILIASLATLTSFLALAPRVASAGPVPVVGGSTVPSSDWPDVVGVISDAGRCTGTLIAPDVVLTAGHCADLEPTEVVTFANDLAPGAPGEHIKVKWTKAYPNWEERYDVSVVMLDHVARPKPRAVVSACEVNRELRNGAALTVVGYGLATASGNDNNSMLRAARIPVIDAFCANAPGCNPAVQPNGEIAAGGRGIDSCFGDSGGPAYIDTSSGPALAGVVSRSLDVAGPPCGSGGIYVRADKVVTWIESVTNRTLTRAECDAPADSTDPTPDGSSPDGTSPQETMTGNGGCTVGTGGAGFACSAPLLLGLAFVMRRRRYRSAEEI